MKKFIRTIWKTVVAHFFIITTSILFFTGIIYLFLKHDLTYYYPFEVIGCGAITSLFSMLFYFSKEPTRGQFILRCVIHFFCIVGCVLGVGYLFSWWVSYLDVLIILGIILAVYVIVWIVTLISDQFMANNINKALKNIRQDE